jgi:SelR domain
MNSDTSLVTVRLLEDGDSFGAPLRVPKVIKSDDAWRAQLTEEQLRASRTQDTERTFCGIVHGNHQHGLCTCVCCGLPLFRSDA